MNEATEKTMGAAVSIHKSGVRGGVCLEMPEPVGIRQIHASQVAGGSTPSSAIATKRIKLIIGDADPLARRVVREFLAEVESFVVAAEAVDGRTLIELVRHYRPDVVLTEVRLPVIDGIEATRQILASVPETRVVMFTVQTDSEVELQALRAGACGFISKDTDIDSVKRAVTAVARGEAAISRHSTMRLIDIMRLATVSSAGLRPVKSNLTSREWEVLDMMCAGATTRDISRLLFLSEDTVYSHSKSILRKLGVHSRAEAVIEAERLRTPTAA